MKQLVYMCLSVALTSLSGCASIFYDQTKPGHFEGRLVVRWEEPNRFVYLPDPDKPLKFTAADGHVFQPRRMYTDAGSIPRLFWSTPGLGPWDFAPGYIIHDWLFEQHHCKLDDWQSIRFEYSADILAQAMKTQMESSAGTRREPTLVWAVHEAVLSPIAKDLWDGGTCEPAPAAIPGIPAGNSVIVKVIEFR